MTTMTTKEDVQLILEEMHYGPVRKKDVFAKLFDGTERQGNRVIERMVKRDLIQVRRYPDPERGKGNIAILLLKKAGADKLAELLGIERELIRTPFPAKGHLTHELGVTAMYRRIMCVDIESGVINPITIKDDTALRREQMGKGKGKETYLADFQIDLAKNDLHLNQILIEFDNGCKTKLYWSSKISFLCHQAATYYQQKMIILVATSPARLQLLKKYTLDLKPSGRNVYYFVTLNKFVKEGLEGIFALKKKHPQLAVYNSATGEMLFYNS